MRKARDLQRFIRRISLPRRLNTPVLKPLLIRVGEVAKAVKEMTAEMGNTDHLYDLIRLDHLYRAMMQRWRIGRNLEIGMRGSENEKDTRAWEMMSHGKYFSVYMDGRVLAGLISLLHSVEAFRCIGWSVSVVYKV